MADLEMQDQQPAEGGYQPEAESSPDLGYGGPGAEAAPLPGSPTGTMQLLLAKDMAKHGAIQLQELDKAAKFRRALSMIQETFATITGREDIAARVRQQIVNEDHQRAAAVESQILARVGRQALEEDRIKQQAQRQALAAKTTDQQVKFQAQHKAGAIADATKALPYLMDETGKTPSIEEATDAFYAKRMGTQTDFFQRYHYDPAAAAQKSADLQVTTHGREVAQSEGASQRTHQKNAEYDAAHPKPEKPKAEKPPKPIKYNPRPVNQAIKDFDGAGTEEEKVTTLTGTIRNLVSAANDGKIDPKDPATKADLERVLGRKKALLDDLKARIAAPQQDANGVVTDAALKEQKRLKALYTRLLTEG